jgi:hypothetical protein
MVWVSSALGFLDDWRPHGRPYCSLDDESMLCGLESIEKGNGGPIVTVIHPKRTKKAYRAFEDITGKAQVPQTSCSCLVQVFWPIRQS